MERQNHEDREKLEPLRLTATEAFEELDQGEGVEVRSEAQLESLIQRIGRRAAKSAARKRGE